MASFKLCISDPSTKKTFQREVKDSMASPFIGLNIGETIKGDSFEMNGYEFLITGGSDYCGFPMRKGILGLRKSLTIYGGVGFRGAGKGIKRRKTVCGHKIHDRISQINLKVMKQGAKKLAEIFGAAEEAKKEETKENKPEAKKEAKEEKAEETEAKEHKTEHKKEAKEHKAEVREQSSAPPSVENKHEKPKEGHNEHKAQEAKHEKPAKEHKETKEEKKE